MCDVQFLCHAKPKDVQQAAVCEKLVENTIETPDAWEAALSGGKDKRENFERRRPHRPAPVKSAQRGNSLRFLFHGV